MRPRPNGLTALACAAVVAVVGISGVAGCGGDDGDDAALSRDEFVTQANAICATGNAAIEAGFTAGGPPGPPSGAAAERLYETVVTETQRSIDGVAALEPPEDMRDDVDALIAAAESAMSEVRATPAAEFFASTDDPFAEVNGLANELGLTDCGTSEG